ncbi:MAG: PaaI family thioesterase [Caulobacter sp.]|nr:PaaI family thioesterase [Caulobacter sp.]
MVATAPSSSALRLDAAALNDFMGRAFPASGRDQLPTVIELEPGRVLLQAGTSARNLRPGGVISGPTLMGLADAAAYTLVLAHIGEVAMAVTTSLNIHFLRPCKPGDLVAEGRLLRLGRRIATVDVLMWTEGRERAAAQATVAYAIPDGASG